jgi:hypothetical protein
MSNANGWGLTARLIGKHFGGLGDQIAGLIAGWDPETATEADRDRLQAALQGIAQKLSSARSSFDKEHSDVVKLQAVIANDEKSVDAVIAAHAAGTLTEDDLNVFCDGLEANKVRLPQELAEEEMAKEYVAEVQQIVDVMSKQLSDFDASAKKVRQALASAQAQEDLQAIRLQRQNELSGLTQGLGDHSTAMQALTQKAEAMSSRAAGMKIVADLQQKPVDQANRLDAIRNMVATGGAPAESAADRLRRLTSTPAA